VFLDKSVALAEDGQRFATSQGYEGDVSKEPLYLLSTGSPSLQQVSKSQSNPPNPLAARTKLAHVVILPTQDLGLLFKLLLLMDGEPRTSKLRDRSAETTQHLPPVGPHHVQVVNILHMPELTQGRRTKVLESF